MKTLLNNCKSRLRSEINYIRNTDIYITEDIRLIRKSGNYPAIALKDGGIDFASLASDTDDQTLMLTAVAYVSLQKQEAMLVGATGMKGVLEVAADIVTALRDHTFSDTYDSALPVSQGQSEILVESNKAIMMVPIIMQFTQLQ